MSNTTLDPPDSQTDGFTPVPRQHSLNRRFVTVGLMLAMLLTAMESTVVSTAMPTVIGDLHGIRFYAWVFTAYLLTSTATVPIYGKLADLFGRRSVFLFSLSLFLLGSALSGAAHTMPQLILFRGMQGVGAGGVLPLTLTIIGDLYDLRERARVQVLFTTMWGTASLAGPIIGAALTEALSWRWVFYINIPFGMVAGILVGCYLKETHVRKQTSDIDYLGSLLLTCAVIAMLTLVQVTGIAAVSCLLIISIALVIGFVAHERRAPEPLLPLSLFAHPVIAASMVGNVLIGVMLYSMDSFMPLFMQGVRGGNAHSGSIVLTPLILCWSLSAYFGAKALIRFGFRRIAVFGSSCMCGAALILTFTSTATPTGIIIFTMGLLGTGLGPASMSFLVSAQNAVEWKQRGVVTASSQFFRSIGGTLGVGALGAVLHNKMTSTLLQTSARSINANDLLSPAARALMSAGDLAAVRSALGSALHLVFLIVAGLAVFGLFSIIRIVSRRSDRETDNA